MDGGSATDVLGELLSVGDGVLVVRRADGNQVRIVERTVRAAKRVPPGPARIRPARAADADAIEALRVGCWRSAYRGMIPDTYLDALPYDLAADVAHRRRLLSEAAPGVWQVVADAGGVVVGWAGFGPSQDADRDAPTCGEVYACYVDPRWSGYGLGGRLLRRGLDELAVEGRTDVALLVLAANDRARRFYASWGFVPDGVRQSWDLGGPVVVIRCIRASPSRPAGESLAGD